MPEIRESNHASSFIRPHFYGRQPAVNEELPPLQATTERANAITSGHRACQGCGEALGARYALDAAMALTDGQLIAANATGCWKCSPPPIRKRPGSCPGSIPCSAMPGVASGIAAALKAKGQDDIRVIAQGGDGGTTDIGFGCLSGNVRA